MADPLVVDVVARIRPMQLSSARSTVPIKGSFGSYECDAVLGEATSQEEVFGASCMSQVNSFLQGRSSCTIICGARQTGKTFTLEVQRLHAVHQSG